LGWARIGLAQDRGLIIPPRSLLLVCKRDMEGEGKEEGGRKESGVNLVVAS